MFDAFEMHAMKWNLNGKGPLNIFFFGDTHDCADASDDDYIMDIKRRSSKLPRETCLFLGMGDYGDFASTSERRSIKHGELHDTTMDKLHKVADEDLKRRVKTLEFMRGRLIGLHCGNHDWEYPDGSYASERMAVALGCRHLGYSAYTRLRMAGIINGGSSRSFVDIFSSHGKGSGRLLGSPWNTLEQMTRVFHDADIYCVSDDTEILTLRGWQSRQTLRVDDKVGTFDIHTEEFRWSPILDRVEFDYDGPCVHMHNRNMDAVMHPKHRVVYKYTGGYLVNEAQALAGMSGQINVPLAGHIVTECVEVTDTMLALCGWIVAEGSFGPSGIRITQKPGDKADEIANLLRASGMSFTQQMRKDGMSIAYIQKESRHIVDALLDGKRIPSWLFKVSDRQFDVFLGALARGDGTRTGPRSVCVYQKEESFIDDLQGVCSAHGYRTSKKFKAGGFKDGGWSLVITKVPTTSFALSKPLVTEESYRGVMWCVTTEQSTFIARRNGKVFVTGNCMGHDHSCGGLPDTRLYVDNNSKTGELELKEKKRLFIRTGSALRGYVSGKKSYISKALYKPCSLGFPVATVEWKRDRKSGEDVILKELHSWA